MSGLDIVRKSSHRSCTITGTCRSRLHQKALLLFRLREEGGSFVSKLEVMVTNDNEYTAPLPSIDLSNISIFST